MVGLSIVLEAQKASGVSKKTPQVISKTAMILNNPSSSSSNSSSEVASSTPSSSCSSSQRSSFPSTAFLDQCNLCRQKLLPGKDIYMYKGDRAFCSVECRCKQIFMDEEESVRNENCSVAAMKPSATSSSSSSSSAARHHRKGTTRNPAGGFAY